MMDSNIQEKVHKVEEFFDGHLKPQLVRAIAERYICFFKKNYYYQLPLCTILATVNQNDNKLF